eukprot:scaffold19276_cov60-Attheya_sp.AAC.2
MEGEAEVAKGVICEGQWGRETIWFAEGLNVERSGSMYMGYTKGVGASGVRNLVGLQPGVCLVVAPGDASKQVLRHELSTEVRLGQLCFSHCKVLYPPPRVFRWWGHFQLGAIMVKL